MSSFDGIEVGSFSLIVLPNPYLSMSGMNTELDKRVLFMDPLFMPNCSSFRGPQIECTLYFLGTSNLSQLLFG